MLRFLLLLCVAATALAGTLPVDPCPGSDASVGVLLEVYSSQFNAEDEIILRKGETYDFGIKFISGENSVALEPTIFANIGGIDFGWNGANKEACQDLQGSNKCPLLNNREYHYYASIKVLPSFPSVPSFTFQWGLTSRDGAGKKGNNQACFRLKAKLQ